MQTRRKFLQQSSFSLAGLALLQNNLSANPFFKNTILGVQLYSVRDDMNKDPLGTLKAISKMGYKYVEHANYTDRKFYGYPAADFKKLLNDLGMQMKTGHTTLSREHWDESKKEFTPKWHHTVEDAAIMGQKIVISPWLDDAWRKTADDMKRYMGVFNKSGELCKKAGMKFGYHNHDFEFSQKLGDTLVFDLMMQNTDPSLVTMQLDTGNMYHAGAKAKDILQKYPGRFESLHVKDEIISKGSGEMGGKYESTVLGKGIVPVKEICELAKRSGGTKYFIVEQESYQDISPLDCMQQNLKIMKKWGY